jgi:Purple acid Phosphatase, N-terminal domain
MMWRKLGPAMSALVIVSASISPFSLGTARAVGDEPNDQILANYGTDAGSEMWLYWRGPDTTVSYGSSPRYGKTAAAAAVGVRLGGSAGAFHEVELTGLAPATIYHYKIGYAGFDHILVTASAF